MISDSIELASALEELHIELSDARLDLGLDGDDSAHGTRTRLADQIGDYLLPRLRRLDAPLLAVIGGSTGSGKSTITNSLVGNVVSPSGVLRPTTRSPVLVCHPEDTVWFTAAKILPDLARSDRPTGDTSTLAVKPESTVPRGIGVLDAPDIDSIESANRDLAAQLLGAADLWIFVTTAARYADAVPWELLGRAQTNGTALALVVSRLPDQAGLQIVPHLESMLADADLEGVPVFPIDEVGLEDAPDGTPAALLPDTEIGELREWLRHLGDDADARAEVIRRTLAGALKAVPSQADDVADHLDQGSEAVGQLEALLDQSIDDAQRTVRDGLGDGTELRSEVLDRWQELVGTGDFMRGLQARVGRFRDVALASIRGAATVEKVESEEIENRLENLIVDAADAAALATAESWRTTDVGQRVLTGTDATIERAEP